MNQKRITNQILNQTNYTLNSTLNYLFNISNMKKLFSYLLISSMVILSSCTNYDDQFDDLNTQINSLKSQIEGFSSLSSGLTSLQGTVASLQSAVAALPKTATPATDISGLEAAVAALQTALSGAATSAEVAALTADLAATQAALDASIAAASTPATDISGLEATVAELKTSLAAASTSAEITALTAELAAAEVALTAAVAANATAVAGNTTDIAALATSLEALSATIAELQATLGTVSTADEVTALAASLALAQADLTAIIASSNFYEAQLDVTTQTELDFATQLGNKVAFLSKGLKITQTKEMDADKLLAFMTKVRNVTGDVVYSSTLTTTTKPTFVNLTGAGSVDFSQDGDISLPSLVNVNGVLKITGTKNTTTVSLPKVLNSVSAMSFNSLGDVTTFSMPAMVNHNHAISIQIDNAGTVDMSAFTNATAYDGTAGGGEALDVNAAVLTAPVYAKGKIEADRLTSVSLPKWAFATGSTFDRAATVVLPSVAAGKVAGYEINIDTSFKAATSVHFIASASTVAKATAASHMSVKSTSTKLETLILGGVYTTVDITGSDVTSITFDGTAHTVKVNATDVETLNLPYTSAAKGALAVTANTKLTSLTADKVNGLASFTLTGNSDLTDISFAALDAVGAAGATVSISGNDLSIESVSDKQTSPVVAKKVVSADFAEIKTFLTKAIAGVTATSGTSVNVSADLADVVRAYNNTGAERDAASGDEVIAKYSYLKADDNSVGGVSKVDELYISALGGESTFKVASIEANGDLGDYEAVSLMAHTGLEDYYDIKNWADAATTTAALSAAGLEILSYGKGQKTATFEFADATLTNVSAVVTFADGGVETVSVTTGSASTTTSIATAIKAALDAGDGVLSKYYTVAANAGVLTFSSNAKGSHRQNFDLSMTADVLSGTVGATAISFASASTVADNSIESTSGAYIRFKSTTTGAAGAKSITLLSTATVSATLLTASGVDTTKAGDDENVVTAVTGTPNTADNSAAIALVSVNNVQFLAGA